LRSLVSIPSASEVASQLLILLKNPSEFIVN
jgi:hypothetical protein